MRRAGGGAFTPFRLPENYTAPVDGKPRHHGVRALRWGDPRDPPGALTLRGLDDRDDVLFVAVMGRDRVEVFEGTVCDGSARCAA